MHAQEGATTVTLPNRKVLLGLLLDGNFQDEIQHEYHVVHVVVQCQQQHDVDSSLLLPLRGSSETTTSYCACTPSRTTATALILHVLLTFPVKVAQGTIFDDVLK